MDAASYVQSFDNGPHVRWSQSHPDSLLTHCNTTTDTLPLLRYYNLSFYRSFIITCSYVVHILDIAIGSFRRDQSLFKLAIAYSYYFLSHKTAFVHYFRQFSSLRVVCSVVLYAFPERSKT